MITVRTHCQRSLTRLAAVLGLAALGALAAPVQAQPDPGNLLGLSEHDYLHRDMVIFAQGLNLDDGQRMIVESLYEDYRDAFDAAWLRTQQGLEGIRDMDQSNPTAVLDRVLGSFESWDVEKQRIKERFEEDVKILLNPDQLQQWDAFQRRMTREKTLPQARLSGENVDLFHVVRDLHLDERTMLALEPVMLQYDLELDLALTRRNQTLTAVRRDFLQAIRADDASAAHARVEQQIQRRAEVRNVNDRHIETIAGYLNEPKRSEFRDHALRRGYPRVFSDTPAQRLFRDALRMTGLDPDVQQGIVDLNGQLTAELAALNSTILAELRDHEPKALRNQSEVFAARQTGQRVDRLVDPTQELIRSRNLRTGEYIQQLRELVGEDQFARIPGAARWTGQAHRAPSGLEPADVPVPRQRGDSPRDVAPEHSGDDKPRRGDERNGRGDR